MYVICILTRHAAIVFFFIIRLQTHTNSNVNTCDYNPIRIQTREDTNDHVVRQLFSPRIQNGCMTELTFFPPIFSILCRLFMFNANTSCTVMTSLQDVIFFFFKQKDPSQYIESRSGISTEKVFQTSARVLPVSCSWCVNWKFIYHVMHHVQVLWESARSDKAKSNFPCINASNVISVTHHLSFFFF